LACGASKVSIASAAAVDPSLITQVSQAFGSDKVVIAIDAKKVGGEYHVFIKGGREDTGLDLVDWAKQCEQLGAGEIVVNSMDGDGTKNGYDIAMTQAVTEAVSLPVVASGGCGRVSHVIDVFEKTGCQSALVASLLHYGIATITDIKNEMRKHGWQTL
jgi:cyclase